jgi:probable F420-dependent oxidoreductase
VKVDSVVAGLAGVAQLAREQEADGYDGIWSTEVNHDPFLPLVLAAEHTERIELGTGIAVAFARNPMTVAYLANDVQAHSAGRFILGLGSQVKAHVERRFAMAWSRPVPRMREFILALRAIWRSWNEGTRLDFRGAFYRHTLMTPFFSPGPNAHGPPRVFLAAVGERMAEVAGEVADGLCVHPFTTARYLREVTIPAVERGLASTGRTRQQFEVSYPAFVVTGADEREADEAEWFVRQQIAFYGSTPAYRPVLELHGWGNLQVELNALSRSGRWATMGELIDDDVLHAFAVACPLDQVAPAIVERFGGAVDRTSFSGPITADPERRREVVAALQRA